MLLDNLMMCVSEYYKDMLEGVAYCSYHLAIKGKPVKFLLDSFAGTGSLEMLRARGRFFFILIL